MKNIGSILKNLCYMLVVLVLFFVLSLFVEKLFHTYFLIPALFTLAVFLVSVMTEGLVYGIVASFLSMLALNYAFTFPYFKFNFSIPENLVSAVIMLIITFMSSALIMNVKQSGEIKAENAKEKMRANLLRAVSHDLRSPLTTIYGSSSVIIDEYDSLTKEQVITLLKGIKEDSQWLIGMVENLLSVTRIDNGNVRINKIPTVLEELIDSVLVKIQKRYPNQEVIVDIPEDFISIPMDAVLIEQVIVNLIENAIKHAEGMTELILKVFVLGDYAVFEVLDDGCGIPKDRIENIFSGTYVAEETPADFKKSSMGIGLSVCATIIKAHSGTITAENRKTGGCCFRFALEMEAEENE